MKALRGEEIKLKVEDIENDSALCQAVRKYFDLLKDYMDREQLTSFSFVHAKEYF